MAEVGSQNCAQTVVGFYRRAAAAGELGEEGDFCSLMGKQRKDE